MAWIYCNAARDPLWRGPTTAHPARHAGTHGEPIRSAYSMGYSYEP